MALRQMRYAHTAADMSRQHQTQTKPDPDTQITKRNHSNTGPLGARVQGQSFG